MMSTGVCRWLFLLISLSTWTTITSSKEMRVVCYYTNWSVYRPGAAKFSPQNINPYLCTHLIYAFGGFTKENTLKPFDKYQDIEKGGYAKFTGLKTYNKNLKTMLAIGGWNEGSTRFSPMVANAERRKELVKNSIKFLRQNHFDGLDLDWEYPSFRDGGKARDRDNYALLVQELREEFDRESEKTGRPRLLLTMAVPAGIEYVNKGYDIPKLTKYLDWMNILSYDYHSAFEPAVNHHAPLYSLEEDNEYNYDADLNIDFTIKHYMKLGADPKKLVLGIPTYGRSYTLYNPDAFEIGSPADGPGDMGEATRENGYLAYYEICENVKNQDWEVEQPNPDAMGPYAFKDNQWVGYDDENIVRKKSEYVAENGLGGIMFWAIDNDDFRGTCHGKPYPLIEAAKEALLNAYGITDDNLISPPAKPIKPRTRTRTKTSSKSKADDDEEPKVAKVSSSSGSRSRNRNKLKSKNEERDNFNSRQKSRRKDSRKTTEGSTYSSLKIVTPSYTTPAPPSTPDSDGAFKCEDEGFFPHPKDCKRYFWCLSGAGDSGIIAHQFTCPAGLYFNKAADSCDYTQNVLCNKKLQKATTTSATTKDSASTTTTAAPISFTTARVPPKITAATSRTTFKQTTTTESYDADEEYEYDDDEEDESEEDPRVIKELIDLIRKAGGIEELEKQLKHSKHDSGSSGPDATTQAAISKSLYERVKNSLNSKKILSTIHNSRGPQNDGISRSDEKSSTRGKNDRGKLQYTSISRNRSSTSKSVEDDDDNEEEGEDAKEENVKSSRNFSKKSQPEYVTIRRPRVSTTTDASESDSGFDRNKVLGEGSEEEDDANEDGEAEDADDSSKKTYVPQYVNIRRQRPSTTEESATSKYTVINRGSTTESASDGNDESDDTTLKYKNIRRGSTPSPSTTPAEETTNPKYQIRRGTTTPTTTSPDVSDNSSSKFKNFRRGSTTERPSTDKEYGTSKYKTLRRGTTTQTSISLDTESPDISSNKIVRGVTTPLDDDNDVTPRYQAILRSSTTSQYEPDGVTTVSANPVEASSGPSIADKVGTNINLIDELATTQSTVKDAASSVTTEKYSETAKSKPEDSTEDKAASVSTTEITNVDTETPAPQRKRPQLLDAKPFSIGSRGSSTSVKSITDSTTQTSKVSQSNFKFRLRPKTLDVDNKKNIPPTESTIAKSTLNYRSRGSSRFGLSNRNANKDLSDSKESEDDDGDSTNVEVKKRPSTTARYIEDNRAYRPSELADLSSLTAVDFSKIKELNFGASSHRRRVRPTASSSTATSTEEPEETLKTSSRTLPLARKLIESSSFGKSRRIIPSKENGDQIESSSDQSTTKRVRGLASRTTRQSSTTPSYENSTTKNGQSSEPVKITPRPRRIIRRFRAKPGTNNIEGGTSNKTSVNQSSAFNKSISTTDRSKVEKQSPLQRLFNRKPARLPFALQQNKVEEEEETDDSFEDSSTEEGENIKLSESNIRENSDVNSFDISGKQRRKLVKLVKQKSDSFHEKINFEEEKLETDKDTESTKRISDEVVSEQKESNSTTIERSDENNNKNETNINESKEGSNITTIENLTNVTEIVTLENKETGTSKSNVTETVTLEHAGTSTEPNIVVRTRKIIRKIKPTVPSKVKATELAGRKRKIIRRLRPPTTINKTATEEKPSNQPTIRQFRGRTTPVASSTESIKQVDQDIPKRLFRPQIRPKSKYIKSNNEKNSSSEEAGAIKSPTRISLRLYGRTTTTTAKSVDEDSVAADNTSKRAFKPFARSTTTDKSIEKSDDTTESTKDEYISKPLFRPKLGTNLNAEATDKNSTTKSAENVKTKEQISKTEEENIEDGISESTEVATETAEVKSTTKYLYKTIDRAGTTENTNPHLNKDIDYEATGSVKKENIPNTTSKHSEDIDTSTSYVPFAEFANSDDTDKNTDKLKIVKSSTTVYNSYTPPSTTDGGDFEDDDEDDEDTGDRKRNFVSVFRSSTSTNSFDNFDSEFEEETPKFDHSLLEHDIHNDDDDIDTDFDHTEEYKSDNDKHTDDHLDEIDELIGDTSTEFKAEAQDSSSVPSDVIEDEDKTDPVEKLLESSSVRNKLYRPDRPSFIRPRITATAASVEKPISTRPKYKSFSRTKSLTKETIQIHSFNNTGVDGKPETGVNKVLLTNRYNYKTIERTTPSSNTDLTSEDVNDINKSSSETSTEENLSSEDTTRFSEITTILQMLNIEEFGKTTDSNEVTTRDNEINDSAESTESPSEELTLPTSSFELDITTRLNISDIENEIFGSTTASAYDSLSTESRGILSYANNGTVTEENFTNPTEFTTTEIISNTMISNEQNNAPVTDRKETQQETTQNSTEVITSDILGSASTSNGNVTTEAAIVENVTSEIAETTTDTETSTFIIPETTTSYRRRSTLRSIDARPKFSPTKRRNTFVTRSTTESGVNKFGRNRFRSTTERITTVSTVGSTPRRIRFKSTTPAPLSTITTDDITNEESTDKQIFTSSTALPVNKLIYAVASDAKSDSKENDDNEELADSEDEVGEKITKTVNKPQFPRTRLINRPAIANNIRRPNSPIRSNSGRSTTRTVNKPKTFAKTTETPKVNEELSDIDTEAVKNRNKNLFSKKRKMNSPLSGLSPDEAVGETTSPLSVASNSSDEATSQEHLTVAPLVTEPVTKASVAETTELLTTLHHVFAEVKDNATVDGTEATTESLNAVTTTTGKVERLIEVSRIVQVNTKEAKLNHGVKEQITGEDEPFVDKIGEVNRVTHIEVVDGNDTSSKVENQNTLGHTVKEIHFESPVYIPESTTEKEKSYDLQTPSVKINDQFEHPAKVEQVPAADVLGKVNVTNVTVTINGIADVLQTHSNREDRKFEVFGSSKSNDYGNKNHLGSEQKAEIIDGISHINVITPRPILSTEASTIALEGLFQTDSPRSLNTKFLNSNDELLEAENSKFVNVRVLHQEEKVRLDKGVRDNTKFIPIKLLKQEEEEVTMRAKVVEITPKTNVESIKIVPIRVEMSRKLAENLPEFSKYKQNINRGGNS